MNKMLLKMIDQKLKPIWDSFTKSRDIKNKPLIAKTIKTILTPIIEYYLQDDYRSNIKNYKFLNSIIDSTSDYWAVVLIEVQKKFYFTENQGINMNYNERIPLLKDNYRRVFIEKIDNLLSKLVKGYRRTKI